MVTTPALSRVLTSTPDSCETEAVAKAVVTMANRTVPSSFFNLISLSPHVAVSFPPGARHSRAPELTVSVALPCLFRYRHRYSPRFGPTALAIAFAFKESLPALAKVSGSISLQPRAPIHALRRLLQTRGKSQNPW